MRSARLSSGGLLELERETAVARGPEAAAAAGFGVHLTIDGYRGARHRLADQAHIRTCLAELPELLGMHKLIEPMVLEVGELSDKDPGGLSGYVLIAESHISVHTFPLRGFVSADVYTCQNSLDAERIRQYFADAFALQDVETHLIRRGTRYPQHNIYEAT